MEIYKMHAVINQRYDSTEHFIAFLDFMVSNVPYINSLEPVDQDVYYRHLYKIPEYTRKVFSTLHYKMQANMAGIQMHLDRLGQHLVIKEEEK